MHGLSHKQAARLAAYEASLRKEEGPAVEGLPCSSGVTSPLERSIPSVPTMDQLPYLNIESVRDRHSSLGEAVPLAEFTNCAQSI